MKVYFDARGIIYSDEFSVGMQRKNIAIMCVDVPENLGRAEVLSSALCRRRHTISTSSTKRTLLTESHGSSLNMCLYVHIVSRFTHLSNNLLPLKAQCVKFAIIEYTCICT